MPFDKLSLRLSLSLYYHNPVTHYQEFKTVSQTNVNVVERSVLFQPLGTTSNGKFTIICKLIDESTKSSVDFRVHFFTSEDFILKQIEQGDIVSLNSVKVTSIILHQYSSKLWLSGIFQCMPFNLSDIYKISS